MEKKFFHRLSVAIKGKALHVLMYREGGERALRFVIHRTEVLALTVLSFALLLGSGLLAGNYLSKSTRATSLAYVQSHVDRVKSYEANLLDRATALETMIADARDAGPDTVDRPQLLAIGGGVGGREISPGIIYRHAKSKLVRHHEDPKDLVDYLEQQIDVLRSVPLGLPVQGSISSDYGRRISPFSHRVQMHDGIDISVDRQSPVVAVADGSVVTAGFQGTYGYAVLVEHGNGFETLYGHLSKISVNVGDRVCRGQKVGLVGSTGRSTGPHVHYEIRVDGQAKDPNIYLQMVSLLKYLS